MYTEAHAPSPEKLRPSNYSAALHLNIYQPPRELHVTWAGRTNTLFDITGKSNSSAGFNHRIAQESYAPLIDEGFLNNPLISWNLLGITVDWLRAHRPDIFLRLLKQMEKSEITPVGDTYLHTILPLISDEQKRMLIILGRRVYRENWGTNPQQIWLPESAIDYATLTALTQERMPGVLLRNHQVRSSSPANAYRLHTVQGSNAREITAIITDNELSKRIGFDRPRADVLTQQWCQYAQQAQFVPRLAVDGETFGEHWKKSDGAFEFLKWLTRHLTESKLNFKTEGNLPEAVLNNNTSWSCLDDGLGRWKGSDNCSCDLPTQIHIIRAQKKDLFNKLSLANVRIDRELDNCVQGKLNSTGLTSWRKPYMEWFLANRHNLAIGAPINTETISNPSFAYYFLLAYIRDIALTSCGMFFGGDFERQIPRNCLQALAGITGWTDIKPLYR